MSAKSVAVMVKSFGPDGKRRRNYSVESAMHLIGLQLVIPQYHRKTQVVTSIHFYDAASQQTARPISNRWNPGTRYSFREAVAHTKAWTLDELPRIPVDAGLSAGEAKDHLDLLQKAAFLATVISVLQPETETGPEADNVVSINAFRRHSEEPEVLEKQAA